MAERGRRRAEPGTGSGDRYWNRTFGQWVRSVVLVFLGVGGGLAALAEFTGFLFGTLSDFIGRYIAVPGYSPGSGALFGALVGLTAAAAWGWLGRPRLLARGASRVGGTAHAARVWDGDAGAATDRDPAAAEVT